ncbi:MAG TPA: MarR family transcriptional regulator [Trebonia sp.]|jgi:DNA-binding MarR family transcriptional regulator|nr:MarR family transcriptional regulator [Trebonia sp.]
MREEGVYRLQQQLKRLQRRVQREQPSVEGLSHTELQLLVVLERAGRPLRPGDLAAELQMTTSNVATTLRSLEAGGLVARRADPADGRKALVSLTSLGTETITGARRDRDAGAWLQEAVFRLLTMEEQAVLERAGELMQRLAEAR